MPKAVGHGSFERLHEKESWERVMKRSIWLKKLKSKRLHEKEWSMKKRIWLKDILGVESLHERECMKRSVQLFKHPIYVYILMILRAGDYMRRSHEKEWWHLRLWSSLYKLRDGSLHEKECMKRIWAWLLWGQETTWEGVMRRSGDNLRLSRSLYKLWDRSLHEEDSAWKG